MLSQLMKTLNKRNEVLLSGAAGTGKTTLVKEVVRDWNGEVLLIAPTGKAARRLEEVVEQPATTIHSAIFGPPDTVEGEPIFKNIKRVGGRGTLIIVDEVSMVGVKLLQAMQKAARPGDRRHHRPRHHPDRHRRLHPGAGSRLAGRARGGCPSVGDFVFGV